jgi:hypothetical protein
MATYTVTAVSDQVRDWSTQKGAAWKSYRVTLRNAEGREKAGVELARIASAPKPEAGQTVEGEVKQTDYGPKLFEPRKAAGGGGFRDSPETRRSIAMQSSVTRAVEIVRLAADTNSTPDVIARTVESVARDIYALVQNAEKGA